MHPRKGSLPWMAGRGRRVRTLLEFVCERGVVDAREVDEHFAHGRVTNLPRASFAQ